MEFVKQKWKTLRDGYKRWKRSVKTVRSGSKATKKKYCYGDVMAFLDENAELRETESSHDPHNDDLQFDEEEEDADVPLSFAQEQLLNDLHIGDDVGKLPDETSTTIGDDSIPQGTQNVQKRKSPSKYSYNVKKPKSTKLEAEMSEYFQLAKSRFNVQTATPTLDDDEDLNFFKSLVPSLRALDMPRKLQFRMEVMKALQNVLPSVPSSSAPTNPNHYNIHSQQFSHHNMQQQHFPYSSQQLYSNMQQYPNFQNMPSNYSSPSHLVRSSPVSSPQTPASHLNTPLPSPASTNSSIHSSSSNNSSSTLIDYTFVGDNQTV